MLNMFCKNFKLEDTLRYHQIVSKLQLIESFFLYLRLNHVNQLSILLHPISLYKKEKHSGVNNRHSCCPKLDKERALLLREPLLLSSKSRLLNVGYK